MSAITKHEGSATVRMPASVRRAVRAPRCPSHVLSAAARKLWRAVVTTFDLEFHQLAILEQACVCVDRLEQARAEIAKHGLTLPDRYGVPKANPAVAVERDSRIALARLLRELRLDDDPALDNAIRPPRLR